MKKSNKPNLNIDPPKYDIITEGAPQGKVYCKDCENNGWSDIVCFAERNKNEYTGQYSLGNKNTNVNGDCKYYKRLWYKFWVKR
jgi:hypothetical protein